MEVVEIPADKMMAYRGQATLGKQRVEEKTLSITEGVTSYLKPTLLAKCNQPL